MRLYMDRFGLGYNILMRRLPPFEEKIRVQIRDEMAKKPLITVMAIKERMEEVFGRGFDYTYIRKLTGKVRNEISYEIDTAKIEPRLAFTRENYRLMREELLKIVYWKDGDPIPKPLPRRRSIRHRGGHRRNCRLCRLYVHGRCADVFRPLAGGCSKRKGLFRAPFRPA
jgi:hypothetical protein